MQDIIILTLSVPVIALLGIGVFKLAKTIFEDSGEVATAIGYVDEVGIFDDHTHMGVTDFIPFSSRDDAKQALAQEEIAEYFVIPEDYLSFGAIQRYTPEKEANTPVYTV